MPPGRKGTLFSLHIQLDNHQKDLKPCLSLYYYDKFITELEKNTIKEFNCVYGHSVPLTKFSKKEGGGEGGLTGSQFLEGGCWERGGDFFRDGGAQYLHKKYTKIWNI